MKATWETPGIYKGDADKVAAELQTIETVTPESIVDTGKNGTDIKKALAVKQTCIPISFATAEVKQTLVPTTGLGSTNVLASYLVFDGWKCEFDVSCVDIVFPYETVLSLINATGEFIGIGTQRANSYGRYHIGGAVKIE